jgi:thiamine biosynthesis lipoprotein
MGLPFRIVLYAPDEASATAKADAAFKRISELNNIFSDYDYDSELSALSRSAGSGQSVKISEDLWAVLNRAQKVSEQSRGAFDITVGPAVNLWRYARRTQKFPDTTRLEKARAAIGYRNLRLNRRHQTAELLVPDMRLDLGAIAKGYAVDEALNVLKQMGVTSALVSGGGDLAVSAPPPGAKGWRIELSPAGTNAVREFVVLSNRALATSGDLFQFVELDGKRYSHIVDPRTGIGLTDRSLVVVIARDCMTADSLSTAASVLGPQEGLTLVRKTPGAEGRILRQAGPAMEKFETTGFSKFLE